MKRSTQKTVSRAVIKVGDGRGFIMEEAFRIDTRGLAQILRRSGKPYRLRRSIPRRIVVTAAHCLPKLPPADPNAFAHERTYPAGGNGTVPGITFRPCTR